MPHVHGSHEPAWSLSRYLLIGLVLRGPAVWFGNGFEFVDQQFQYVDPAWHLATGQAWHATWEWLDGIRSWVYPGLLAGVFRALQWVGCDEPLATMRAVRGVHAVVSLLPLWLFWLLVVRWRPLPAPRLPLLLFASSGLLVGGVQPNGPALAATLCVTAGFALAGPTRFVALAGLCLGLAFCCRFQDALFGPPFLAVLLWQRRWSASAVFALACVPGIVLQGCVDLAHGAPFLAKPWRYVASNVGLGSAGKWQAQPFLFYLYAGVVPVLCLLPPMLRVAGQRLWAGAALLPAAFAGAVVHLVAHSFVARKALRFEYGALALLLAVVAVGLPAAASRWARWHSACLGILHGGLFVWTSFWFGNAGAVQAALWLREQPGFDGRVVVVGGDATAVGGAFYARPPQMAMVGVARDGFAQWARANEVPAGSYLVAVREPLGAAEADAARLELVASFTGSFDLRRGERRFVYRRRP